MNLNISISITDPEMLEAYKDVHNDIIASDFLGDPKNWLDKADIQAFKVFQCPKCEKYHPDFSNSAPPKDGDLCVSCYVNMACEK